MRLVEVPTSRQRATTTLSQVWRDEWGAWLKRNFALSHTTATTYMKLAAIQNKSRISQRRRSRRSFTRNVRIISPLARPVQQIVGNRSTRRASRNSDKQREGSPAHARPRPPVNRYWLQGAGHEAPSRQGRVERGGGIARPTSRRIEGGRSGTREKGTLIRGMIPDPHTHRRGPFFLRPPPDALDAKRDERLCTPLALASVGCADSWVATVDHVRATSESAPGVS